MERLTARYNGHAVMAWEHENKYTKEEWIDMLAASLAAYEDLEEQGRLVVLPCKVGDTVFGLNRHHKRGSYVMEGEVKEMYFAEEDMRLCIVVKGACRGEWGKVIFGTREEAERALAGGADHA